MSVTVRYNRGQHDTKSFGLHMYVHLIFIFIIIYVYMFVHLCVYVTCMFLYCVTHVVFNALYNICLPHMHSVYNCVSILLQFR